MSESAHVFVEFVSERRQCLFFGWVGDGWDCSLAVCQGNCVKIDFVVIESGKELSSEHCLGYVLGEYGKDFMAMA